MNTFIETWQVLLIPLAVLIISQFAKVAVESVKKGFSLKHINSYGGMPSSHTALFVSITLMVGLTEGWSSPLVFVTGLVSLVFIRDAVGLRRYLGRHGQVLNVLMKKNLSEEERKQFPNHLEERLGHTYPEVFAGGVLAVIATFLLYCLL
ncbi:MAG: divergent PAP2 family protein [Candidatus Kerfeldbacteria bacterium]